MAWSCSFPSRPCHDHVIFHDNHDLTLPWPYHGEYESIWSYHVTAWSSCLTVAVNTGSALNQNKTWSTSKLILERKLPKTTRADKIFLLALKNDKLQMQHTCRKRCTLRWHGSVHNNIHRSSNMKEYYIDLNIVQTINNLRRERFWPEWCMKQIEFF